MRKRKGKKEGAGEKGVVVVELGKENSRDGKEDIQEPLQQTVQTVNGTNAQLVPEEVLSPLSPGADGSLDPAAKKARNLNKKVCGRVYCFHMSCAHIFRIAQGHRGA